MKQVKCAVAAVLRNPANEREFLAVKRPPDDDRLPDAWGLPAVTLRDGELPEEGLRRIGREKLATDIEPARLVGIKSTNRGEYELILMDIEARLVGPEPDVSRATTAATRYVGQQWTEDLLVLQEAARKGSVCSQVLLDAAGVSY